MERWTLPAGWEWSRLRDLVNVNYGKGLSANQRHGGDVPVFGANGVVGYHDVALTQAPTIVVGRKGSAGSVNFSEMACWPIDTTFFIDEFPTALFPQYLFHFLRSQPLVQLQQSAAIPGLNRDILFGVEVPIPYPDDPARSLAEQRRIVARLEALLGEVREMRQLQAEIEADVGRLMEAVLAEVFPDPTGQLPSGWIVRNVGDISKPPQYGYTQSAQNEPVGPRFLRITDIQDGLVDWSSVPYSECDQATFGRYKLIDGDIVFARSGATTGKTLLITDPPDAVFASYLIRLQIINDATPDFVYWFFQSPNYWKQIVLRGGAQPNMNAQILRSVRVPILADPLAQSELVAGLNNLRTEVTEMRAVSATDTAQIAELEQSILAQAFRGEL